MIHDHEARKSRVGASEVAAILCLNEDQTPLDVWMVKTARKPHFEGNEHTRRGQRHEAQILEWLAEDLGRRIATDCPTVIHSGGLAAATPDGFVLSGAEMKYFAEVCVKADGGAVWELIELQELGAVVELAETKSTLKSIRDESEIPVSWLIQAQWQMLCTGLKKCHLGIFGPMVSNYQRFEITFNQEFADELLAQVTEWWRVHIFGDKMPELTDESDVQLLYPQDDRTTIEASEAMYKAVCELNTLKAQMKDLDAKIQPLRDRITIGIGSAQVVRYGGQWLCSYKKTEKGRQLRTL